MGEKQDSKKGGIREVSLAEVVCGNLPENREVGGGEFSPLQVNVENTFLSS